MAHIVAPQRSIISSEMVWPGPLSRQQEARCSKPAGSENDPARPHDAATLPRRHHDSFRALAGGVEFNFNNLAARNQRDCLGCLETMLKNRPSPRLRGPTFEVNRFDVIASAHASCWHRKFGASASEIFRGAVVERLNVLV